MNYDKLHEKMQKVELEELKRPWTPEEIAAATKEANENQGENLDLNVAKIYFESGDLSYKKSSLHKMFFPKFQNKVRSKLEKTPVLIFDLDDMAYIVSPFSYPENQLKEIAQEFYEQTAVQEVVNYKKFLLRAPYSKDIGIVRNAYTWID